MEGKASKFNARSPAVKRILQEIKEIHENSSPDFIAEALEDDIFEWHFVIRGTPDSEFQGGIYHGRILLPSEYPFKPPSFMMLSPSGRFQTNTKICLSISSHHPEHWQPSWSVRTALTAMIAFMPTPGNGALGSLDFPKEERCLIAKKSRLEIPRFGSAERQSLIDEMHQRMLDMEASMPSSSTSAAATPQADATSAPQQAQQEHTPAQATTTATTTATAASQPPQPPQPASPQRSVSAGTAAAAAAAAGGGAQATMRRDSADTGLTLLAVALSLAIAAILIKKVLSAMGSTSVHGV